MDYNDISWMDKAEIQERELLAKASEIGGAAYIEACGGRWFYHRKNYRIVSQKVEGVANFH